jgi:hypothetical protein
MKHIKTFSQIFESRDVDHDDDMSQMLFQHLIGLVTWPDLAKRNPDVWASLVTGRSWKEHLYFLDHGDATSGEEGLLSKPDYKSRLAEYQPTPAQRGIDTYIASDMGYHPFPSELGDHDNPNPAPIETFMAIYHQPRYIAELMHAEYYENYSPIAPNWETI